jgi:hypothetical protein
MNSDMTPQASSTTAEHVHESYVIEVGTVLKVGLVIAVISALAIVGLRLLLAGFEERHTAKAKDIPARLLDESGQYAGPNLQENPIRDHPEIRAEEFRRLTTYAYDSEKGVAHVPIDRAIDVLTKKGLPTREDAPAKSAPAPGPSQPQSVP